MTESVAGHIARPGWDVPVFDVSTLHARVSRYCVVIPVINEGSRLTAQLREMARRDHMALADLIIADGGSTDGSTDLQLLAELGVTTLLVKRGPGKLSAQLRMAYAWALEQGYEGIVTIDGNGKDGVETLPDFLAALDQGFDYVQASRFLPGGKEFNTPRIRRLAIRWVHAPILSLAAGRWLTDTTQGYRAYSARYLLDLRVQPFRAVFSRYELLAYLTVRASQIGLRVTELPTSRTYPNDGTIPTKISAVRGNLNLIETLWHTLMRRYHPATMPEDEPVA